MDAAISSGNSGGGMFNTLGQLQGVPTLKYDGDVFGRTSVDNIGMCIPINVAKPMIKSALEKYNAGEVADMAERNRAASQKAPRRIPRASAPMPRMGVRIHPSLQLPPCLAGRAAPGRLRV